MNVVYILVSDETDVYLEQSMISIVSLRRTNSNIYVYLLVDKNTEKTIINQRAEIRSCVDQLVCVDIPDNYNKKDRSRYIKTSMYDYIPNDFLYIDADTVVCNDISTIEQTYPIACVLDRHYNISEHPLAMEMRWQAQLCGYHTGINDCHFNTGLIWVKKNDTVKKFFEIWHGLWKNGLEKGRTQDQTSFNESNYVMHGLIHELDGVWNCQISNRTKGLQYLNKAKVIHYFASNDNKGVPYDLADNDVIKSILKQSHPKLDFIIENPKDAFSRVRYIVSDKNEEEILQSQIFSRLKYIKERRAWQFAIINRVSFCLNYIQGKSIKYLLVKFFSVLKLSIYQKK